MAWTDTENTATHGTVTATEQEHPSYPRGAINLVYTPGEGAEDLAARACVVHCTGALADLGGEIAERGADVERDALLALAAVLARRAGYSAEFTPV